MGIDTSGGVGHDKGIAPQQAQDTNGVGYFLIGVTLIVVHPPLHHGHLLALQLSKDQAAFVPRGGGRLEIGDIPVVDQDGVFHLVPQCAQAGTQHHRCLRGKISQPLSDGLGAGPVLFHCVIHKNLLNLPVLFFGEKPPLAHFPMLQIIVIVLYTNYSRIATLLFSPESGKIT